MSAKKIDKDERTTFIENQSYRYGYIVMNFGILFDIMYRSFKLNEASWDLFGLIFLGGLVTTVHQYRYKIFTKKWTRDILLLIALSAIVAGAVMFISQKTH
jgi:hypothetical protein